MASRLSHRLAWAWQASGGWRRAAAATDMLRLVCRESGLMVFPPVSFSRMKGELALLPAGMPAWVLHDLRRSAASGMASLGTAPHVIEAVLNHRSGAIHGVAATYNRFNYAAEKRAALDLWTAHVAALTAPFDALAVCRVGRISSSAGKML